ncbi:hypothetical protein B0H34DRAFT_859332 [Crassisporium funariophilum]|nr:hypothetical protein B0H34DRAFT_859332 [Crassisporium funariophilum]
MRFSVQIFAAIALLSTAAFETVTATPLGSVDQVLSARDAISDCRRTCGMRFDIGGHEYLDCIERCQDFAFNGKNAKKSHKKREIEQFVERSVDQVLSARDAISDCRRTCGMRFDIGGHEYLDCIERCQDFAFNGKNAKKSHKKREIEQFVQRSVDQVLSARDAISDCRRTCGMRFDIGGHEYLDCIERCQDFAFNGKNAKKSHKKREIEQFVERSVDQVLSARDAISDCRRTCGMRFDIGGHEYLDCIERCQDFAFNGKNAKKSHKKREIEQFVQRSVDQVLSARDAISDCRRTCGMRFDIGGHEYLDCIERCQDFAFNGKNAKKSHKKREIEQFVERSVDQVLSARDAISDCRRTCGMRFDIGGHEYLDCIERCQDFAFNGKNAKKSHKKREVSASAL